MSAATQTISDGDSGTLDCSIIIPTRDRLDYLKPCIESILESQCECRYEILIVDNESTEKKTLSYLENIIADDRIRIIRWHRKFNYSEINNEAARQARGNVLCLLNNDTRVITKSWLDRLVPVAALPEVGAAGALLLYPDDTIQHGGIALDGYLVGRHIAVGEPADYFSANTPDTLCRVQAVTGACLFTRRDLYLDCGGFNELELPVSFNDVDYCLRVAKLGYAVLLDPAVRLYHFESVSRQSDDLPRNQPRAAAERQYMLKEWGAVLAALDAGENPIESVQFMDTGDGLESTRESLERFLTRAAGDDSGQIRLVTIKNENENSTPDTPAPPPSWERRYKDLEIEHLALRNRVTDLEANLADIRESRIWKLTAPVRWVLIRLYELKQWCGRQLMKTPLGLRLLELRSPQPGQQRVVPAADLDDEVVAKARHDAMAERALEDFLASGRRLEFPALQEPALAIVLVFFNRAALSYLCLQSILDHAGADYELIVVDNASRDQTDALLSRLDNVTTIKNEENLGFVGAVNQGAAIARGGAILLLNNDALLEPGAVDNAMTTLAGADDIGAVGGQIVLLDGTLQEAGSLIWKDGTCQGYGRGDDPESGEYCFRRPVDYCSGAFLMFRRDVFEELGGFDEVFAPAYYEETDFCIRLCKTGRQIVYEPTARITHYEFASTGGMEKATRLQARHREILCQRHEAFLANRLAADPANVLRARTANALPNVLFIDDCVPHPELGAGYPRCAEFLREVARLPLNVTFYPLQNSFDEWTRVYQTVPRSVEVMLYHGRNGLRDFLQARKGFYRYILVSRADNMAFFRKIVDASPDLTANTRLIYDAEAILAPREVMRLRLEGVQVSESRQRRMIDDEMSLARDTHRVVTVSSAESDIYRSFGMDNTLVLGHRLSINVTPGSFEEREGVLFVGALRHDNSPNVDSLLWFVDEVLPELNEQLGRPVAVFVVGDNSASRLHEIQNEQVRFLGRMTDIAGLYDRCRVFIAPTRFAAGIPHKIHEAASYGIPSVATSLLAGQLGWHDGEQLLVGDTAADFAAQCARLHTDRSLWQRIREGGIERVRTDCSPETFTAQVASIFN